MCSLLWLKLILSQDTNSNDSDGKNNNNNYKDDDGDTKDLNINDKKCNNRSCTFLTECRRFLMLSKPGQGIAAQKMKLLHSS